MRNFAQNTFCKQKPLFPWLSACGSSLRWSVDMLKNSKWLSREPRDPLTVPACAGATFSTPEKANISRKRKVQTNAAEKKRNVHESLHPNVSAWDRVNEFKDH